KAEARRLVEQGAVRVNGEVVKDWRKAIEIKSGMLIQVGRRKFVETK
ncbi:MAG: hypothetical protein ACD_63C00184G0001, partial [uncultured bacterium]